MELPHLEIRPGCPGALMLHYWGGIHCLAECSTPEAHWKHSISLLQVLLSPIRRALQKLASHWFIPHSLFCKKLAHNGSLSSGLKLATVFHSYCGSISTGIAFMAISCKEQGDWRTTFDRRRQWFPQDYGWGLQARKSISFFKFIVYYQYFELDELRS